MTKPLVSIVIPVFNGADLVGQAIESALAQSWPATEVIVVDDGSSDGGATRRAVSRFGDAVRFVTKPNGGVSTALNAGIAAMRGAWFAWLSHDDIYHPERIARHMAVLRDRPAGSIAFGDVDVIAEDGTFVARQRHTEGFPDDGRIGEGVWAVLETRLNGCAMTIPRDCLLAAGGFDPGLPTTQDYALWFRLAWRHPFVPVPGAFLRQRNHPGQGSRVARHLDEASIMWAGFVETLEAEAGTAEERLAGLLRAERRLRRSSYVGARMHLEEHLRRAMRAFPVDLVLRGVSGAADISGCLDRIAAAGATAARVTVVDEGTLHAPALAPLLSGAVAGDVRFVRSGVAPLPEALAAVMLGAGTSPVVAVLDATALPGPSELGEALRRVAAREGDILTLDPDPAGTTVVASRRALEDAASEGSPDDRNVRAVFARLNGRALRRGLPHSPPPPYRAIPVSSPGPDRLPAGGRWIPRQTPVAGLPTVLLMLHDWGGGTERYAKLVGQHLAGRANVLYATARRERQFRLSSLGADRPEVEWDVAEGGLDGPIASLRALGVDQVDVLHTIGFETWIEDFLDALAAPYDVTLLDYHLVASRTHLIDEDGGFIGDAALDQPDHPARRRGPPSALLQGAERIIACSRDLAWRAKRLTGLDIVPVQVPEPQVFPGFAIQAAVPVSGEPLRVAFIGQVSRLKGGRDIAKLAQLAMARDFPLKIFCLGQAAEALPAAVQQSGMVEILGSYDEDMLQPMLCALRPHLAWLPFRVPETYSFALSDCMLAGLPILATGIGAIPERVAGRDATWLVPPEEATTETILAWLARLRDARMTVPPRWLPIEHLPPLRERFYQSEYLRSVRL